MPPKQEPTRTNAARHAVLNTYELLESILLGVPVLDLLTTTTKTCRTWRDTFVSSKRIRKLLFESKLPDQWDDVDGIIVNGVKGKYRTTPWIFRTDFRLLGSLQGHILVLYTGTCKWTIYAPTDRTLDMEINRLRLEIECEVVDNELVEHAYLYPGHQVPTVNQVTKIRWRDRIHGTIDERSFRKQAFPIPFWNDTFIEDTFESEDEERNKQDRMLLLYAASPSRTWILIGRPVHESICLAMGVAEEMEEMGHVVESPVHFFGADFSVAGKGCLYRTVKKALRLLFRAVGGSMIRQSLKWRKYRDK